MRRAQPFLALLALALSALLACATVHAPPPPAASAAPTASGIQFIEDDYPTALARAKAQGKLLFVDVWATWCHTCLSMRAYVFPDAALSRVAGQFVWLSLDADHDVNKPVLERFDITGYPTLLVLDPGTERPARIWLGSYTAAELAGRLADAADTGPEEREARQALERGHAHTLAGQSGRLDYEAAVKDTRPGTVLHAQAAEALVATLQEEKRDAECVAFAEKELPLTPPGTSLTVLASSGLACALELPKGSPERAQAVSRTAARVGGLATDMSVVMLADDRSGLFETLVDAKKEQGDDAGARASAVAWRDFLEGEAQRAPTPAARAVFDPHRLLAYIELGEVEKAVPMLEQTQKDFPQDFNPPARLALAYLRLHKPEEALRAATRAEALVYGPRTVRVMFAKADAQASLRDPAGVSASLAKAEQVAQATHGHLRQALLGQIADKRETYRKLGVLSVSR
jgi:thiol-disulfide isomerase/thioredoxin